MYCIFFPLKSILNSLQKGNPRNTKNAKSEEMHNLYLIKAKKCNRD